MVDKRVVGNGKPGPVFAQLLKEFREVVKEPSPGAVIFK
jgi:hypothetical protein